MAIVTNNPFVAGLRGMLGGTLVFRTYGGRTVVSSRAYTTRKQSELQKLNCNKFKDAAKFAKAAMRDPAKKEYYQKKARKLKLPNAYTAALTDYMRKPVMKKELLRDGRMVITVVKKDFDLKRVELVVTDVHGTTIERAAMRRAPLHVVQAAAAEYGGSFALIVEDDTGKICRLEGSRWPLNSLGREFEVVRW